MEASLNFVEMFVLLFFEHLYRCLSNLVCKSETVWWTCVEKSLIHLQSCHFKAAGLQLCIWIVKNPILKETSERTMTKRVTLWCWTGGELLVGSLLLMLCKEMLSCIYHGERGETVWVTLTNELYCLRIWGPPCSTIKPILFPFATSDWRSPSLFFCPLVRTPTTSCVSEADNETRLTMSRGAGGETGYRKRMKEWGREAKLKVSSRMHFSFCPWFLRECGPLPVLARTQWLRDLCVCLCVLMWLCRWVHSHGQKRDQECRVVRKRRGWGVCLENRVWAADLSLVRHVWFWSGYRLDSVCISGR